MRIRLVAIGATMAVCACVSAEPSPASSAARSPASASASVPQPSVAATRATTPSPANLPGSLIERQAASWVPTGPTLIVTVAGAQSASIVAVPLDGATPTPLLIIRDPSGSVPATVPAVARGDGALLALAVANGGTTRRIALVDLIRGQSRWLTAGSGDDSIGLPAWAADGSSLYFGTTDPPGVPVIAHVGLDGTALPTIRPAVPLGSFFAVSRVTIDGVLVGSDEFNGPTVWAMDLSTGQKVSFGEHNSALWAWRSTRPRFLVSAFTNIAAPGTGYLALWDGATAAKTILISEPVGGADFDPFGTTIVAAVADRPEQQARLVVMNADGSGRRVLAGTDSARAPIWTTSGIAYQTYVPTGPNEVRIVSPGGGVSRTLYTTMDTIQRMQLVTPP